ncbi:FG-GAP repeat protein [Streptomyces thermolineatus]|uniref:FG-GAP repeat protein n=1 Tax=Streptomyces thermolineatus TaxID=44033 RepID=A0ABN3MLC5_9ACTN
MPKNLCRTLAAATVAAVTGGLLTAGAATPAAAAVARYADDFNGDGYRDIAYGGYNADGHRGGAIRVVYGTASGPAAGRTQLIHQDSAGIPGVGEEDDQFGESLTSADLNKDGYADVIAGNPMEHVGSDDYRGSVTVVWGSASGLSGGTALPVKTGAAGHFGRDLAAGDFNGDGSPDLAVIGGLEAWLYRGGFTKSGGTGSVSRIDKDNAGWSSFGLASGKVDGDGRADLVVFGWQPIDGTHRTRAWFLRGSSAGLSSGASKTVDSRRVLDQGPNAAIGDFDKDGYGDIALGDPDESSGKGSVTIWYGTSSGPSSTRSTKLTQATSGVTGAPEVEDNFAYDLSAGDTDGDGYADLAVGVPYEEADGRMDTGGLHLFRGGSGGLTGSRSVWITQGTANVLGAVEDGDSFGYSLSVRDLNRDGRADLAVASGGDVSANVLPGSVAGPTGTGSYTLPALGGAFAD